MEPAKYLYYFFTMKSIILNNKRISANAVLTMTPMSARGLQHPSSSRFPNSLINRGIDLRVNT